MIQLGVSGIHGTGAFAASDLAQGTRIGIYEGRRYTMRQAQRRDWDHGLTYAFGLSDGSVIDATQGGNATRHINHSCSPNCEAFEARGSNGRPSIEFYAMRDIAAGEELFLDYRLEVDGSQDRSAFDCSCGSDGCRGTMLAAS
jgi:SET domain-containing protein